MFNNSEQEQLFNIIDLSMSQPQKKQKKVYKKRTNKQKIEKERKREKINKLG